MDNNQNSQANLEDKAQKLIQSLDNQPTVSPVPANKSVKTALVIIGIILAGAASGYGISKITGSKSVTGSSGSNLKSSDEITAGSIQVNDIVGVADEKSFPDEAEGVLIDGGIDGEGSHHILRKGGPSQNVYLTSSIVDLSLFSGYKVQVWGETFAAQKAGWLMDVGRIKVLELNPELPFKE